MHWALKAATQKTLSHVPGGGALYTSLQRAMGSLPPSDESFLGSVRMAEKHAATIEEFGPKALEECRTYEFGAGATLVTAMTLYAMGLDNQVLTDVFPLARPWLLKHTVDQFERLLPSQFRRLPRLPLSDMGINYIAPHAPIYGHARQFDVVTTKSVLEHLPANEILPLLDQLRRRLSPGGIMVHHIDYSDHFGLSYPRISIYNFLRYSEQQWSWFNSDFHYQNRMRHPDYVILFEKARLEIIRVDIDYGTPEDLAYLDSMPVDSRFSKYSKEELSIAHGYFVVRSKDN